MKSHMKIHVKSGEGSLSETNEEDMSMEGI